MARGQLRAEAKRRGIRTTDAIGRELSDVELQLELTDTPETRTIKRQLRTMNPQQRAQALRMLQAQADEAQRTGVTPAAMRPPKAAAAEAAEEEPLDAPSPGHRHGRQRRRPLGRGAHRRQRRPLAQLVDRDPRRRSC